LSNSLVQYRQDWGWRELCGGATAGAQTTAPRAAAVNRSATVTRKNVVAIQVKPFCWVDEGIDKVLDTIQEKGNVNTVFVYTYDFPESRFYVHMDCVCRRFHLWRAASLSIHTRLGALASIGEDS
jgi:hypothetical protein